MARVSVESAKTVINSLLSEQDRDREYLQRMMAHSQKMTEHLTKMRDDEDLRIEAEASERKSASHRLFDQLLSVEEERRLRLEQHLADIEGKVMVQEHHMGPGKADGMDALKPHNGRH